MNTPRRKFGFWLATALVVGNIIGAGIFLLPASLAPFGWNAVLAWVITGTGALCLAWVFATMARHLPHAGGSYGFMRSALGEAPAFLGAWGYLVSVWAGNAAITIAGVSYLTRIIPAMSSSDAASPVAALIAIWLLTWVNLRGPRAAGGTQLATTIIKLLPFAAVIWLAVWRIGASGGHVLLPLRSGSLTLAGATGAINLTLYAMLGLEAATMPADAVDKPERIVPLATMVGSGFAAVVSLAVSCAVVLMAPAAQVASSHAPLSDLVATSWGGAAGWAVAVCATVSAFGCLNGWLFIGGELPASMAMAGTLPSWFDARNVHGAPARSILVGSVITTLLVAMSYTKTGAAAFNFAVLLTSATCLVMYLLCVLAVIHFMRARSVPRSASLVACTAGAFAFVAWAFIGSGREALGWGAALVVAGWPLYRIARRARQIPST